MNSATATVILSKDKKGTHTANSEYIFHIPPGYTNPAVGLYEGRFKNVGTNKSLHYHKITTEIFTVMEGEFYFNAGDDEFVLGPNDSLVIPPGVIHGFRAKLPGSRLQFVFTGGVERKGFFEGIAKIANKELVYNDDELEAFFNKYDQYTVK